MTLPEMSAPVDDGAAKHLIAGTRLPDIALAATRGADVTLARFQERAVVFLYPMTGTPGLANPPGWDTIAGAHGSTPEAEGFRDHYAVFQQRGIEVFGVSGQAIDHQRKFARRAGLPFQLLSDPGLHLAAALRLPTFETGGVCYLKRLTLYIRDGVIYRTFYPVHPPEAHAAGVLDALTPVPI